MGLCYGKPSCRSSTGVRHQSPGKRSRSFRAVPACKHQTGYTSSPGGSFRRCTFQELLSREDGVPVPVEVTKQRNLPNGGSCSSFVESDPDSCGSFQGETTTSTFTSLEENDLFSSTSPVADFEEIIAETSSESSFRNAQKAWLREACSGTSCSSLCTEVDVDSVDDLPGVEVNFVDFLCVHSRSQAAGTNSCKKRPSKSDSNLFSGSSNAKKPRFSSHEPEETRTVAVLVRPEEQLSDSVQRILVKAESEASLMENEHRLSLSNMLVKPESKAYEQECLIREYRSARAMTVLLTTRSSAAGSLSSTPFASAGSSFSSGFLTPPSASFTSNASTPRMSSSHPSIEEMAAVWGVFNGQ